MFVFVFRRFFGLLRSGEAETRTTDRSRRPGFIFSLRSWPARRKKFENLARTSVRRIGGAGLSPSTVPEGAPVMTLEEVKAGDAVGDHPMYRLWQK